jgi:hypothetical protein
MLSKPTVGSGGLNVSGQISCNSACCMACCCVGQEFCFVVHAIIALYTIYTVWHFSVSLHNIIAPLFILMFCHFPQPVVQGPSQSSMAVLCTSHLCMLQAQWHCKHTVQHTPVSGTTYMLVSYSYSTLSSMQHIQDAHHAHGMRLLASCGCHRVCHRARRQGIGSCDRLQKSLC